MIYRVGEYQSLVEDYGYVVQRKVWYGWKNIAIYLDAEDAISHGKRLKANGHKVTFYI